ncbi:unnamed protein product [Chondrus crispus]|uniref:Uncharacterized protein n=1 Tax=Chondrus crispus TaxID=2769 RepID=R7QN26_CHOCR|nr:unnamed protein product [Chondrus crispus]CDF38886.1 unnamed protein product [Chondrus crispus]|eukprot:XP_005718791.1 unnamed protein product [Chondrus crispus]
MCFGSRRCAGASRCWQKRRYSVVRPGVASDVRDIFAGPHVKEVASGTIAQSFFVLIPSPDSRVVPLTLSFIASAGQFSSIFPTPRFGVGYN